MPSRTTIVQHTNISFSSFKFSLDLIYSLYCVFSLSYRPLQLFCKALSLEFSLRGLLPPRVFLLLCLYNITQTFANSLQNSQGSYTQQKASVTARTLFFLSYSLKHRCGAPADQQKKYTTTAAAVMLPAIMNEVTIVFSPFMSFV